jgi:hypothetical protein
MRFIPNARNVIRKVEPARKKIDVVGAMSHKLFAVSLPVMALLCPITFLPKTI